MWATHSQRHSGLRAPASGRLRVVVHLPALVVRQRLGNGTAVMAAAEDPRYKSSLSPRVRGDATRFPAKDGATWSVYP